MSSKPTISQANQFRRFNESASSPEKKLRSDEKNLTTTSDCHNSLVESLRLPSPPPQLTSRDFRSVLPLASAAGGNGWDRTAFLSTAGTATATTTAGALSSLEYSGLAGTSPRSCLEMSRPWPVSYQFDRLSMQSTGMNFPIQFPNISSSNPFLATSRELMFKMEALDRLNKAIDSIPIMDKIDLLAALQAAPELVSKESDYFRFLRHANFDAKAAADKLVSYWKFRRSAFGDRAFRPMVMTGDGALTLEDIEAIKTGHVAYPPKDSEGCPVVIMNASRRSPDTSAQVRMRVAFYHAQYLSEDPKTQNEGFVILCIVNVYRYDRTAVESISMLINIFPMKVKAWHTFDCIKDRNSLEQGFLYGFMEVFLHSLNKLPTSLYSADMEDIVWELVTEHGLSIDSIPDCIGGTWTYDMFQKWFVERIYFEKNLYSGRPVDGTVLTESRRFYVSPRPHKRSKSGEEEKSLEGDDVSETCVEKTPYESESIEELLAQFQKLLLHTDSSHETSAVRSTSQKQEKRHFELEPGRPSQNLLPSCNKYEELQKALNAISVHDKVDYLTAIHVAPELVVQESDPSRFLSFHDYDAQKAAQGLVRYWKQRRELFGDRAFLPMTLTGNGALNAEDIEFQKCGVHAITGQDQHGSTVLVLDPSRRTTDDRAIRIRVCFYTWQVLFDNPVNQERGFIGIHIIRSPNYDKTMIEGLPLVLSLFPIKLKALHTYDLMKKIDLFQRGFVQGLSGVIWSAYTTAATFFHSPHRPEQTLHNLETQHGLSRTVIPDCIGGSWTYSRFDEFWNERKMLERRKYPTLVNYATTFSTIPNETHVDLNVVAKSSNVAPELIERPKYHDVNDVKLPASTPLRIHQQESTNGDGENDHLLLLDGEARHLPAEETAEYCEAKKNAPQKIWEDECCPELFLRVENSDIRKAAVRLVNYWRCRSLMFGSSQYASLTQTGDDALGRKELSILGTGFLNLLPTDSHGRSVLYIDPSVLKNDLNQQSRHRCMFYMMSLMAENEKSQSDGAVLIMRVDPQHLDLVDVPILDALSKALPLKITAIHVIAQDKAATDLIRSLGSMNARVHVHSDQSKDCLLSKLKSFGLTKAGLPKFVNGDWGVEKFFQWQEFRTRIEWKIPTCHSGRDYSVSSNFPAMKPYTLLPDTEAAEHRRRMNLIHFRRKQNRSRIFVLMLKENCNDLQQEKAKLLRENEELEALYTKAKAIVSTLQADE